MLGQKFEEVGLPKSLQIGDENQANNNSEAGPATEKKLDYNPKLKSGRGRSISPKRTFEGGRKDKSLSKLCTRFIEFCRQGHQQVGIAYEISLDSAAQELQVERRRLYDVVNVLESIGIITRKAKNVYEYRGFEHVADTLKQLAKPNPSMPKKEKSLGSLSRRFVKLFLATKPQPLSLEEAAQQLIEGDTKLRTKVRRLYDIANILLSLGMIQRQTNERKPSFLWLGATGTSPIGQQALSLADSARGLPTSVPLRPPEMQQPSIDDLLEDPHSRILLKQALTRNPSYIKEFAELLEVTSAQGLVELTQGPRLYSVTKFPSKKTR